MTDNKMTMLIADDVEVNRSSMKEIFKRSFDVIEASGGEETLQKLRDFDVDIVILDIFMPDMDGTDVLIRMRADSKWQKIPVLIKTAVDENREVGLLELGADDFIVSPFEPALIINRVKNLMQKYIYEQKIIPDRIRRLSEPFQEPQTVKAPDRIRTALILSPDDVYAEYLAAALDRCAVETDIALNAKQAVRECTITYSRGGYDIYLIDLDSPQDVIFTAASRIAEFYPGQSGRIVGIYDNEAQRAYAEGIGIEHLLDKPVGPREIKKLIEHT
jgi:DNA-binding response OmpR family regulator